MKNKSFYEPGTLGINRCKYFSLYATHDVRAGNKNGGNPYSNEARNAYWEYKTYDVPIDQILVLLAVEEKSKDANWIVKLMAGEFVGWTAINQNFWSDACNEFRSLNRLLSYEEER